MHSSSSMHSSNRDKNKHGSKLCINSSNSSSGSSSRNTAQAPTLPPNTSSPLMASSSKVFLMVTPTMLVNKETPDVQANPKPKLRQLFRLRRVTAASHR